jgi:transposase-like protein
MAEKNGDGGAERRRLWAATIGRHGRSGLSVDAFCRREDVSPSSFYRWRRRLGRGSADGSGVFVSLGTLRLDDGGSGVEVVLDSPVRLRVRRGFDASTLRAVLAVLAESPDEGQQRRSC